MSKHKGNASDANSSEKGYKVYSNQEYDHILKTCVAKNHMSNTPVLKDNSAFVGRRDKRQEIPPTFSPPLNFLTVVV